MLAMPSIGVGIGLRNAVTGRARTVHPLLWLVAVLFLVYFAIHPISDLLT